MAVRYICDWCEKEIKDVKYQVDMLVHKNDIEKSITTSGHSVMDLCENCYEAFENSLKKGVKK